MGFLTSIADVYIRRSFTSVGLYPKAFNLDAETTLNCWIPTSPSTKPILLLIHGLGFNTTWQWQFQIRPLSRHFSLLIPDLLFFGGSTTTSPNRSELFQAECLLKLLDKLHYKDNVSLVGTSYGGFVAYHLARLMGERVRKVVIASSDLLKDENDDVALKKRAGVEAIADLMIPRSTGHVRTLLQLSVYRLPWFMPEFLLRDIAEKLSKDNLMEKMELIEGITLGDKNHFQVAPLSQEVLIVWGEHDNVFPLKKAHEMKERLGEKARLEVLENTSHVPQMEDPRGFNEVILGYLLDDMK